MTSGPGDERGGELGECIPVGQGQRAGVVEFILGALVFALPANDPGRVTVGDPVPDGLLHDAD